MQEAESRVLELEDQMNRIKWRSKEEIDELHTEKASLMKELTRLQQFEQQQQGRIVTDVTDAADDKEELGEIQRLTESLRDANEKLETRESHIRALDDKRIELLNLYDRATKEAAELRKELSHLRTQLDIYERTSRAELDRQTSLIASSDMITQLQKDRKEAEARCAEVEKHVGELEDHLKRIKSQSKEEIESLISTISGLEDSLRVKEREHKNTLKQMADDSAVQASLQTRVLELEAKLEKSFSAAATHALEKENLIRVTEEKNRAEDRLRTLDGEIQELRRRHNSIADELDSARRQLQQHVVAEKIEREHLLRSTEANLATSQQVLEKALARVAALEKVHAGQDQLVVLHRELANSRKEIAEYAEELLESAQREDAMQQNIVDLQQEVMVLIGKIKSMQEYIDDMEDDPFAPMQSQRQRQPMNRGTAGRMSYDNVDGMREGRRPDFNRRHSSESASQSFETYSQSAEKYKILYTEASKRCTELENEILSTQELSDSKAMRALDELHDELGKVQAEKDVLQRELYQARKDMADLKTSASAEKFRVMYVECAKRVAELEKEVMDGHEQMNSKTMQAMEDLHAELGQVQAENHDLQRDLHQARKEASDSKMVIQQMELRYQEKCKELQDVKDQLRKVRSSVSDFYGPLQKMFDTDDSTPV